MAKLPPSEQVVELRRLHDTFRDPRHLEEPETFFPEPSLPTPSRRFVRSMGTLGEVLDLRWPSAFSPFFEELEPRFSRHPKNRWARARLFRHRGPARPTLILLHGYLAGRLPAEEKAWPIDWWMRQGLDLALFILPFHGSRSTYRFGRPAFPSDDPRMTIDGFRQAIGDLRALTAHLLDAGAPAVGALGMSLGGYTTALLATLEPRLSFAVPFIPLASIPDFAREAGQIRGTATQREETHAALEELHSVISPLSREVLVPPKGRMVIAGRADRVTPLGHAERLAAHFEVPVEVFHGGHLLQSGRGGSFREMMKMLAALDLVEPT